jgi:thiamine-phosphate diphosphorylase
VLEVSGEVRAQLRGVYALFDPLAIEPIGFIEALLRGGIRIVQIRAKAGIDGATLIAIVTRIRAAGGIAILNDDVGLARLADGVHLGQEDAAALDMPSVRRAFGPRIIGLSCGTPQEARAADPALFDYVAAGPLFATTTKEDAGLPIGINGARAVVEATALPCAVIGGITLERVARAKESGAAMVALASALVCDDPESAARASVEGWG